MGSIRRKRIGSAGKNRTAVRLSDGVFRTDHITEKVKTGEKMENFTLKDNLRHRAYSFPKTVLDFKRRGEIPDVENDTLLLDGTEVPYEVEATADGYILRTIADLPYNSEHEFVWHKGRSKFKKLGSKNAFLSVKSLKDGLYAAEVKTGGKFSYRLATSRRLLACEELISGGAVETVFKKTLTYENGGRYTFTLKLKRDLDYLEIFEQIEGFEPGQAKLEILWENFRPDFRYAPDRGEEKIDAYTDESGKFPFVVNPFMPCTSWWDQRCCAYTDKRSGFWSGILLHDLEHFDDGEYAIWGSRDSLAFTLYENRIEGGIKTGTRAFMHILCGDKSPDAIGGVYLRYYSIASLNKVKDYVLDWADDQKDYPKYFRAAKDTEWGGFYGTHTGKPTAEDMMNILDRDTTTFAHIEKTAPVSSRAYRSSWAQTFDLTAGELTSEEFARVRAAMAFVCYTYANENYYPIENMLAGHPNFLTDIVGTVAVFASILGKNHPMHDRWLAYYEIALARNFKYHIRPTVEKLNAKGGRWTENAGCYMLGMLHCVVDDCHIVYALNRGEMPMLYPHIKPFIEFLVNMTAPQNENGRRLYMPMGAHCSTGEFGGKYGSGFYLTMIKLADMLRYYEPNLSEYLLHNFRKQADFEGVFDDAELYGAAYRGRSENRFGTSPELYSCKYTGLGFMLRDHVNRDDEMQVFLQQIDEGPNYRWGRAANGGCGEIYYYANRKSYTDHAPEDVGDENRGDVQSCTNFGVLVGHEYKSVGRNDLTEPLMDFGFAKYARINAGEYSKPYYRYRAVMMVENRYVAVYDAVADKKQVGRFVWAQKGNGEFPVIRNIRPAVNGVLDDGGIPADRHGDYGKKNTKTLNFDGQGDFLTVVTHLRDYCDERALYSIDKKSFGAELVFPQTRDEVFFDNAHIFEENEEYAFDGYVGYLTETHAEKRLAIFNGAYIRKGGFALKIPFDKTVRYGMSAVETRDGIYGSAVFGKRGAVEIAASEIGDEKLYIDGETADFVYEDGAYRFEMPLGTHRYRLGLLPPIERAEVDRAVVGKGCATVKWKGIKNALEYEIDFSDDLEYTWKTTGRVKAKAGENLFEIKDLADGKYHVRVRGINGSEKGEYSHAYPVYVNGDVPHCPEGLRIERKREAFVASWGEVPGADGYKIYKIGESTPVYCGRERFTAVGRGEYCVTAFNGNGESERSLSRSTQDVRTDWDHHPEKEFVRDCRSHEHGYGGFDYIGNKSKTILKY